MIRYVAPLTFAMLVLAAAVPPSVAAQAEAPRTVRAAGMPLADGALPPGSLTVRVVRGSFNADLPNVTVHLDVAGRDSQQVTGAKGRAEFAHLPVGATARAWAVVENERLESDTFQMPADSGLRVLLIAGADAGDAAGSAGHVPSTPAAALAPAPAVAERAGDGGRGATMVKVVVTSVTVFAFALVGLRVLNGRRSTG